MSGPAVGFAVFAAALFQMYAGINAPAPMFEFYRRHLGLGPDQLALLYSGYAAAAVLALPACGALSDRLGRRGVVAAGVLLGAAGSALLGVADGFPALLAGRLLQGASVAAVSAPAMAALVELAPPARPERAATVAALALPLGGICGLLCSAAAAEWAARPQAASMALPVLLAALLLPALLAGAGRPAPPRTPAAAATAAGGAGASAPPRRWYALPGGFWLGCALIFFACAVQVTAFAMGGPRLAEVSPSRPFLGAALGMALFLAMSVLGQAAWARRPLRDRTVAGIALTAAALWALQRGLGGAGLWVPAVAAGLCGFAYGAVSIAAVRAINAAAPPEHRGLATSISMAVRYAGAAVPVFGVGAYAGRHGMEAALEVFAQATAAGGACLALLVLASGPAAAAAAARAARPGRA
jgi:MFS family permease